MKFIKWILIGVGSLTVALIVGGYSFTAYVASAPAQVLARSDLESGVISEQERSALAQSCTRSRAKAQVSDINIDCGCLTQNADLLPRFTREVLKAGFDGDFRRISGFYKGLGRLNVSESDLSQVTRQEAVFSKQCGRGWNSKINFTRTYGTRG